MKNAKKTPKTRSQKLAAGYVEVPCSGAAHTNPFIDNCMVCLGNRWGFELRSPEFHAAMTALAARNAARAASETGR